MRAQKQEDEQVATASNLGRAILDASFGSEDQHVRNVLGNQTNNRGRHRWYVPPSRTILALVAY